jgi:GNAT superfamily N-acetyltransferase
VGKLIRRNPRIKSIGKAGIRLGLRIGFGSVRYGFFMPTIRTMSMTDLTEVTRLASQLGYPSTYEEISKRFQMLAGDDSQLLTVAEARGKIVGWVHAALHSSLTSDRRAEIVGLVVDETCRRKGVGKELVEAVEAWARNLGHGTLRLGSNTVRTETHEFYRRAGFAVSKTWYIFTKPLS